MPSAGVLIWFPYFIELSGPIPIAQKHDGVMTMRDLERSNVECVVYKFPKTLRAGG